MPLPFTVLFQDSSLIAIDKPQGFHVHPPEDRRIKVHREKILLYQVRDLLQTYIYPVHRLDAGTSGVLIFALSASIANHLSQQFSERLVEKKYQAVVRGYTPEEGRIDLPLPSEAGVLQDALTFYQRLGTVEYPVPIGKRHPTSRFSLVDIQITTGRYHQIRRHFNRISHPLVGDAYHGDSRQNQFFRNYLGIPGLCLRSQSLALRHPETGQNLLIEGKTPDYWKKIQALF